MSSPSRPNNVDQRSATTKLSSTQVGNSLAAGLDYTVFDKTTAFEQLALSDVEGIPNPGQDQEVFASSITNSLASNVGGSGGSDPTFFGDELDEDLFHNAIMEAPYSNLQYETQPRSPAHSRSPASTMFSLTSHQTQSNLQPSHSQQKQQPNKWATGADLPEEILDLILKHVQSSAFDRDFGSRWEQIHYLGACAGTCKYWASKARQTLFFELYLRKASDVTRMVLLLNNPMANLPSLESLIHNLIIVFDNKEKSWIHLALQAIMSNSNMKRTRIELQLQEYGPNLQRWASSFNSLWYYLPKRLTWLSKRLHTLDLHDVQFQSAQDGFKFFSEFQNLINLRLKNVSWINVSTLQGLAPLPAKLEIVVITESCQNKHESLGILPLILSAGTSFANASYAKLGVDIKGKIARRQSQHTHIIHLLYIIELLRDPNLCAMHDIQWMLKFASTTTDIVEAAFLMVSGVFLTPEHQMIAATPVIACVWEDLPESPTICVPRVLSLGLEGFEASELLRFDWYKFLKATALLGTLKYVEFEFSDNKTSFQLINAHTAIFQNCLDLVEYLPQFPSQYIYIVGESRSIISLPKT